MQRRVWIRQVMTAGAGFLVLPAFARQAGAMQVPLVHLRISRADEALVAALAEAIIPATNTPGARELNLHHFVLKMLDDCYDNAAQARLQAGLQQLAPFAQQHGGGAFAQLDAPRQLAVLRAIRDGKEVAPDLKFFLDQVRRWTIRGYETSEYFLTQIKPYELVPGRYDGCKKIAKA